MTKPRHPEKVNKPINPIKKKPKWIKSKIINSKIFFNTKSIVNKNNLNTVCQEANCPNITECWSKKHATFMIMGDTCTRGCAFCDVKTGKPNELDPFEPIKISKAVKELGLNHVVITSVDRDDLKDAGASHFTKCIQQIRLRSPHIKIEILVPDFRGRHEKALSILKQGLPDVFNHNIETTQSLYKQARPGSCYQHSLNLLEQFKKNHPNIPTKSGIMLGLGETNQDILHTLEDLRKNRVDMVTIGQYLAPSPHHMPVSRYVTPREFDFIGKQARAMGFSNVASGVMVRSSYHAYVQATQQNNLER